MIPWLSLHSVYFSWSACQGALVSRGARRGAWPCAVPGKGAPPTHPVPFTHPGAPPTHPGPPPYIPWCPAPAGAPAPIPASSALQARPSPVPLWAREHPALLEGGFIKVLLREGIASRWGGQGFSSSGWGDASQALAGLVPPRAMPSLSTPIPGAAAMVQSPIPQNKAEAGRSLPSPCNYPGPCLWAGLICCICE